eukprot:scaffold29926_cov69-Phaeocystis_antarctica.AAC.2
MRRAACTCRRRREGAGRASKRPCATSCRACGRSRNRGSWVPSEAAVSCNLSGRLEATYQSPAQRPGRSISPPGGVVRHAVPPVLSPAQAPVCRLQPRAG